MARFYGAVCHLDYVTFFFRMEVAWRHARDFYFYFLRLANFNVKVLLCSASTCKQQRKKKKCLVIIQRRPCDTSQATICFNLHIDSSLELSSWHILLQLRFLWVSSLISLVIFLRNLDISANIYCFNCKSCFNWFWDILLPHCCLSNSYGHIPIQLLAFPRHKLLYLQCVLSCVSPSIQLLCLLIPHCYPSISL